MREINIKANGCHDCRLSIPVRSVVDASDYDYYCAALDKYILNHIVEKTFNPNCPMKEVTQ